MDFCYEHPKKVEKVAATIKISEGHWRGAIYCPVCYKLVHYKFKCKKCGLKQDYWVSKNCYPYRCMDCRDTGKDKGIPMIMTRTIPSWRLKIDDATPEEVLNAKQDTFGMPTMTHQQWENYYRNSPHEREKMRKFKEQKNKEARELLSSPNLASPKDTD